MADERRARLLFVHAHPDDETLATGVAIATYAAAGHEVHVLTATLGDEGEVIPDDLRRLDPAEQIGPERGVDLAAYRRGELVAALDALGAAGRLLGEDAPLQAGTGPGPFRDSGMVGTPSAGHPRALVGADLDALADLVRAVVLDVGADVVVTYDSSGGYGHPDHVRVHAMTCRALATMPAQARPALFAAYVPADAAAADRARLPGLVDPALRLSVPGPDDPYPPSVVDAGVVTHEVVGTPEALARRDAALRAHRTQVTLFEGGYHALSNDVAAPTPTREGYARLDPETGEPLPGPRNGGGRPGLVPDLPGELGTHPREDRT